MAMHRRVLLPALLATACASAVAAPQRYDIDPNHTYVLFTYNHFGFSNPTVTMDRISGDFELDTGDLTKSSIRVTLPLDGLHSGVAKLDADLKSPSFFDAAKFPDITFRSTGVDQVGPDHLKIHGELTVHGVSRPIVLDTKVNKIAANPMSGRPSAGFDAETTLKRSDFGLGRLTPGVSDEVEVHISLDSHLAK